MTKNRSESAKPMSNKDVAMAVGGVAIAATVIKAAEGADAATPSAPSGSPEPVVKGVDDLDGNGVLDAADTDGDAYLETAIADTDGDGAVDIAMTDLDHDGQMDMVAMDTDHDGELDTYAMDVDGDGAADIAGMDIDGDGDIDVEGLV